MNLSASKQSKQSSAQAAPAAAGPRRPRGLFCLADLVIAMLLGTIVLTTACGAGSASVGTSYQTSGSPIGHALAFVTCMRTHGEPNIPDPVANGNHVSINIKVGSGVNPHSPQFSAAVRACKHLIPPGKKGAAAGQTITPAEQADYLRAVACMRSHGFPKFPNPAFYGNNVTFNSRTPIDTKTPQFQRALAICDKLIPAGLPYSGHNPGG